MLAVDRTNEKVAGLYIPYHPSVLRSIKRVVDAAISNGIDVSICGDMAHDERYTPFLLGAGIRRFSVDPMYLPKIQKAISRTDIEEAENLTASLLTQTRLSGIAGLFFSG